EMPSAAPVSDGRGKCEEQQIAAGDKGVRQPAFREGDRGVTGQRRVAEPAQNPQIDEAIGSEVVVPSREIPAQASDQPHPANKLDAVALPVVKANRLDRSKALQCPAETGRGILSSRKQDEGFFGTQASPRLVSFAHPRRDGAWGRADQ